MESSSLRRRSADVPVQPYTDIELKPTFHVSSTSTEAHHPTRNGRSSSSTNNREPNSDDGDDDDGIWNPSADARDMTRMGKTQQFRRAFGFWSALGFVSIYMATWEFVLVSLSVGFSNGGYAGLFWCFLTTVLCYATIVASLAEMESMAPTAGGQYHWVSEFAPPRAQRILSYVSGWMSTLGWLASVASSGYVCATQIEAMVQVTRAEFGFTSWELTLVMLGVIFITIFFNTWGAPVLPALETASLVGHVAGFFVILIPLWVLCPKNSAYDVFVDFENSSGYSMGTAYLISQVYVMYCNLGSDSVVHISEEVEDASLTVPRCMWWSYIGNVGLGIVMLITMLFCLGPLEGTLDPNNIPYLLLFNNTGSPALSVVLNLVLFLLIFAGNITALATCSREMWAFARDRGLPFSKWIGTMDKKWEIPFNSVYATSVICALLSLINLGSGLAFNIIVSVSLLGLLSTYMISIGCVLLKRLKGEPLPHARWSLGRWGTAINGFAFLYSAFIIVFCCFPTQIPVDLSTANWAPLIWVAVMIIALVIYAVHGNKHYTAPVDFVEGRKAAGVGLQST